MQPVIIGVADIKNRSVAVKDAKEPADLILEAINSAIRDASDRPETASRLRSSIDSISVVRTWTWDYPDLPGLLSLHLGINPGHQVYSDHGGNQPAKLLDEAALRLATGDSKVAVLTGGEALASLASCVKEKKMPPTGWSRPSKSVKDHGFRAHRGQSVSENHEESAFLYANFSQVAARNPYAWNYGHDAETMKSIGTVSKRNRIICLPCITSLLHLTVVILLICVADPLLMNAFNTVNLAAACVLTTTEYAQQLQIPKDKWIYPLSGAGYKDSDYFWERPNFFESPSVSKSLDQCLSSSQIDRDEIDLYDFYSCFPIVPKLACHHLGLSITEPAKPITVLGGLTSFGGAGNNYSMHAITEMVRQLRQGVGRNGIILANGGVLSYQHAICISSQPRRNNSPYPDSNALRNVVKEFVPVIDIEAEGKAIIETYTVEFHRDGSPMRACVVGRLIDNQHRFIANDGDHSTLQLLGSTSDEQIGKVWIGWAYAIWFAKRAKEKMPQTILYGLGNKEVTSTLSEDLEVRTCPSMKALFLQRHVSEEEK
ncbi:Thiolase [Penicillium lagena]|uniref:Thiolase n=1 Tax=Penicillium lagena TaxID=94218 RepID=UPI00253FEA45|nr:Thiolase [Penicillium lagena]KAJ5604363.1 Thiolase [Penicillium lagena]